MMRDLRYREALAKAAALKEIGHIEVYLVLDADEKPWGDVTSVEPGGSHRLDIATSVRFTATDPTTGLRFWWSFDIEPPSANGKGSYEIDSAGCADVIRKLPPAARDAFAIYLESCAIKVRAKADEWRRLVERQDRDAQILHALASAHVALTPERSPEP